MLDIMFLNSYLEIYMSYKFRQNTNNNPFPSKNYTKMERQIFPFREKKIGFFFSRDVKVKYHKDSF
jgi:hypothetical protein